MAETKTLSKVEMFALRSAREKLAAMDAEFRALINEVARAHGIDSATNGNDWEFTPDFTALVYKPKPKSPEEKKPVKK